MTQRQVIEFLLQHGVIEVIPSADRKYRQFRAVLGETYWVGRRGAVRLGQPSRYSVSITEEIWRAIERGAA